MTDKKATDDVALAQQEPATEPEANKPAGWVKPLIEFGSLIAFFIAFKIGGIYAATITFMIAHPISMVIAKKVLGQIAKIQWLNLAIVSVMGGLTLYLQDDTFLKMKLTVYNGLFAGTLFVGLMMGRSFLKDLMDSALEMTDEGWHLWTRNYALFLLAMAVVNELVWRNFSTDTWVNFKTFGYIGASLVFTLVQVMFLIKYMPEDMKPDN